jgi:hypothetical protein
MAMKKAGAAFKTPLRFAHEGSRAAAGVAHYLDGCHLRLVERLSVVNDDPEQGLLIYGDAQDFVGGPSVTVSNTATTTPYLVADRSSGGSATPTYTPQAAVGGVVRLGSPGGASVNGGVGLDYGPVAGGGGIYVPSAAKDMWFVARIALPTSLTDKQVLVGMVNDAYSGPISTLPTDGIFFNKVTANSDFDLHVRKAGVSTTVTGVLAAAGVTLTVGTFVELAFNTVSGAVQAYVNGKRAAVVNSGDANFPSANVKPLVACLASAANTAVALDVDSLLHAQER